MAHQAYREKASKPRSFPEMSNKSRVPIPPYFNTLDDNEKRVKQRYLHFPNSKFKFIYGPPVVPDTSHMVGSGAPEKALPAWKIMEDLRKERLWASVYENQAKYDQMHTKAIEKYIHLHCQPLPPNKWVLQAEIDAKKKAAAGGSVSVPGSARVYPSQENPLRPFTARTTSSNRSVTFNSSTTVHPQPPRQDPASFRFYGAHTTRRSRLHNPRPKNYNPNPTYPSYPLTART
mmetsp:Transcript_8039/g.15365  ORF Transcript_8039/g.15365 Transcript_8039/m.15365 type:complete len:232 (+) Transcript_8039:46-741(+)|eukprot:CAMPEP_0175096776 /NCGR_PEP_ID=MMETSP0086_2-20121207/4920_1 /TAXON_ID=136419 /ORGANISM="Unknown Unknown, Strain D1" /LENGTH=231 /DNA_ID=CAMNT_0016370215 /DNA_START=27 /DNA_END=722 /DNA_ORIENTATION=+